MTVTAIKAHLTAMPFTPFDVVTASGKSYHVPHPDFLNISPAGRTCIVYAGDGDYFTTVNLVTITELVPKAARKGRSRK
jgi:hypothetical protein